MNDVESLKTAVDDIEAQIAELTQKKLDMNATIRDLENQEALAIFNKWNVHPGSCIVMFTKLPCGYSLIRTFVVDTINMDKRTFKVIEGNYSDYEYKNYSCRPEFIPFSCLDHLENTYNIYKVTENALIELQQAMCALKIDLVNLGTYELNIGVKQGNKIS